MPTDSEFEELFNAYMFWVVEYDDFDPPVYSRAADVLLGFLQKNSSHPCVHFEYQLESLTHFIKEIHKRPINLIGFKHLVQQLLIAGDKGMLTDTRIASN